MSKLSSPNNDFSLFVGKISEGNSLEKVGKFSGRNSLEKIGKISERNSRKIRHNNLFNREAFLLVEKSENIPYLFFFFFKMRSRQGHSSSKCGVDRAI